MNAKNDKFKHDEGKLRLSLVPRQIIKDVAQVMEFGAKKYGDGSWINVDPQRYRDALYRHFLDYLDHPLAVDEESGLPHLHHIATNVAFLCAMATTRGDSDGR